MSHLGLEDTPPKRPLGSPPRVLLACSGLDHVHRGFETFARECFEALRHKPDLSTELVKGTGQRRPVERVVPTLRRDTRRARVLARPLSMEPFVVEHVSFALSLVPLLMRRRPDVVYFSEWHVGHVVNAWRRASGQRLALVFCNGALVPGGYGHLDRVQQLVPGAIEYTAARGESPDRQEFLPLGVATERSLPPFRRDERARLRSRLALPPEPQIVMSAGAINHQKRMEYLIEEIASMPEPRPFLLLVGQPEAETPAIRALAQRRLGPDGHVIRSVAPAAMADHYRASDAFVLASLWESFGRVLVEAQSHGLPCLAHDYPVMSWILGEEGSTADLRKRGSVARWLAGLAAVDFSDERRQRRHRSARKRFSWEVLAPRYVELLLEASEHAGSSQTRS